MNDKRKKANLDMQNYINGRLQGLEHIVTLGFKILGARQTDSLAIAINSFDVDDSLPDGTPESFRSGVKQQLADFVHFLER